MEKFKISHFVSCSSFWLYSLSGPLLCAAVAGGGGVAAVYWDARNGAATLTLNLVGRDVDADVC